MLRNVSLEITGSLPTAPVVAESNPQPTTQPAKLFSVPVTAEVQMTLRGEVPVYAVDAKEAAEKVQAQMDADLLDDSLEMENADTGFTMRYSDVQCLYDRNIEIFENGTEVLEDEVDPVAVLESEVRELRTAISWDTDKLSKQKAFLESLIEAAVSA